MYLKIWYYFCILFLFYNLINLFGEKYHVNYEFIQDFEDRTDETINISQCFKFDEILKEMKFHQYDQNLTRNDEFINVADLLDDVYEFLSNQFKKRSKNLKNPIQKEDCYFFNNHACFLINQEYLNSTDLFGPFKYLIFAFEKTNYPFFSNYIYHRSDQSNTLQMLKIYKLKLKSLAYPFSKCTDDENSEIDSKYSKFKCLNKCLKKISHLKAYLYEYKDRELLNLTNTYHRNESREQMCLERCNIVDCILDYFTSIGYSSVEDDKNSENHSKHELDQVIFNWIYKAYATSTLEFWFQVFGLIALFMNVSIVSILLIVFKLAFKALNQDKTRFVQKYFFRIKLFIILFGLLMAIILSSIMLFDHLNKRMIRSKIYHFSLYPSPFSIVICMPLQYLIFGIDHNFSSAREQWLLEKYTFEQIEHLSENGSHKILKRIYLLYGSRERVLYENSMLKTKEITFDWQKPVLFRSIKNRFYETELMARCFRLDVAIEEDRYQSLLTISTINLNLHQHFSNVYVLIQEKKFNLKSYNYLNDIKLIKKYIQRSEASCTYYDQHYDQFNGQIYSQADLINNCVIKKYLEIYDAFPSHTVIDKEEIKRLHLSKKEIFLKHFTTIIDDEIDENCTRKYLKKDCEEVRFTYGLKPLVTYLTKSDLSFYSNYQIDLNFMEIEQKEVDVSNLKIPFIFLNVESVFFGINVLNVLSFLLLMIKNKFRFNYSIWYRRAMYVICSICLLAHLYIVINETVFGEMIANEFYIKNDTIKCPDQIFCLKFNESLIDVNQKLTGSYLDNLTQYIKFESVFERISYLKNGSIQDYHFISFNDKNFRIVNFFFLNMRCHIFRADIEFKEKDFHFIKSAEDAYPIKFYLNKSFDRNNDIYFLSKKEFTWQLNEIDRLSFKNIGNRKMKYQIKHELLEITRYDKFKYLKRLFNQPMALFYEENDINDATRYLDKFSNNFKENYNYTTLLSLLGIEDFEFEINDKLLRQFYIQIQNKSDNLLPQNKDAKRQIYKSLIQASKLIDDPEYSNDEKAEIEIYCSFFILKTEVSNAENMAKFIQQILNMMNLWLNISFLEFHEHLHKPFLIFSFIYRLLKQLETFFKLNL